MNICLVNPSVPVANLYGSWDLSAVDNVSPPLGLLFLAAVIRQAGHEVSLIDAYAMGLSPEDSSQRILSRNPDIVGFTATTFSIHGAVAVARLLKNHKAGIKNNYWGAPYYRRTFGNL